jgi:hypothetical protein
MLMKPEVLNGILTLYGILIVYLLIQSLTSNTKEFAVPGASTTLGLDEQAWSNLHAIIHQLYSGGKLTIPGNVHIKGDLLVGTYKDQNGNEKGWDDSIEHTCVWKPTIGGNPTTGVGWMNDVSKTGLWQTNAKPVAGGGVFSFRAGHVDLHPICISRKMNRFDDTITTAKANTVAIADYRQWNPTADHGISFAAIHEMQLARGAPPMSKCAALSLISSFVSSEVKTPHLFVDDISRAEYLPTSSSDPNTLKSDSGMMYI